MAVKRKTYRYRDGDIIDVEEYHDGRYGAPGEKREKKTKPTAEQMRRINAQNKTKRARQRMLLYIKDGDYFATWTYAREERPPDMKAALKDFQNAMKHVRREYRKKGKELFWFRNIERGTKGAWHIHLVINDIGDTAGILTDAWTKGSVYISRIRNNPKVYDEDFTKLASYMTKDEHTVHEKKDGTAGKPRIREANYNISRNMPLPEPKPDKLLRWKKEAKPKKGYYIAHIYEGRNRVTGHRYRKYTMIRLESRGKEKNNGSRTKKKKETHAKHPPGQRGQEVLPLYDGRGLQR